MKSLCKTFADRANQLYFTSTFLLSSTNAKESPSAQFQCLKSRPILLTASSVEEAIKLKQYTIDQQDGSESTTQTLPNHKSGIFLGKN